MSDVLIAQISDPHIRSDDLADEADAALAAAVARVGALEPQPEAVILSGDIANDGTPEQYLRVRQLLAPLRLPVHPLPGNHDDRQALREAWHDHAGVNDDEARLCDEESRAGHLSYALTIGGVRLVVLDTLDSEREWDGGALGPARLQWLAQELDAFPGVPTMIAMHHPPVPCGIPGFDEIGLDAEDRAAIARVIEGAPQVELIVCGHMHRVFATRLAGAVVTSAPSVHLQAELHLRSGTDIRLVPDPPGFSLHLRRKEQGFVSHVEPIG